MDPEQMCPKGLEDPTVFTDEVHGGKQRQGQKVIVTRVNYFLG
jgi:hypothetical protein